MTLCTSCSHGVCAEVYTDLDTPRQLYPRERTPVPTEKRAGWALKPFWTFWRKEKPLAPIGYAPDGNGIKYDNRACMEIVNCVDWIITAQERVKWRVPVTTVTTLKSGTCLTRTPLFHAVNLGVKKTQRQVKEKIT